MAGPSNLCIVMFVLGASFKWWALHVSPYPHTYISSLHTPILMIFHLPLLSYIQYVHLLCKLVPCQSSILLTVLKILMFLSFHDHSHFAHHGYQNPVKKTLPHIMQEWNACNVSTLILMSQRKCIMI